MQSSDYTRNIYVVKDEDGSFLGMLGNKPSYGFDFKDCTLFDSIRSSVKAAKTLGDPEHLTKEYIEFTIEFSSEDCK